MRVVMTRLRPIALLWLTLTLPCLGFTPRSRQPATVSSNVNLLILPGFGNSSEDYLMPGSLVPSLRKRGWKKEQIRVLPVSRTDWLEVFWRGALDWKFWKADAEPTRPAFRWYLDRVCKEVENLNNVVLVCHSAGGWLARAAVGFLGEKEEGEQEQELSGSGIDIDKVLGIVTLGSPNEPPPPGIMDMTRGALRLTHERFPGAYHSPSMFYLTVVGDAVVGERQERTSFFQPTTRQGFAYNSYEAVCGDGTTTGDGVVPLCAAHLDGAGQLNLDGVFHSIDTPDSWYGSEGVLDRWHSKMLQEIKNRLSTEKETPSLMSHFSRLLP